MDDQDNARSGRNWRGEYGWILSAECRKNMTTHATCFFRRTRVVSPDIGAAAAWPFDVEPFSHPFAAIFIFLAGGGSLLMASTITDMLHHLSNSIRVKSDQEWQDREPGSWDKQLDMCAHKFLFSRARDRPHVLSFQLVQPQVRNEDSLLETHSLTICTS